MGYENMMGPPPSAAFSYDAGYVDGRLAPEPQMAPPGQYAGIDGRAPAERTADELSAQAHSAAASDPRRYGTAAAGAMVAEAPLQPVVGRAPAPRAFPVLPLGNTESAIERLYAAGLRRDEVVDALGNIAQRQYERLEAERHKSRLPGWLLRTCDVLWYQF